MAWISLSIAQFILMWKAGHSYTGQHKRSIILKSHVCLIYSVGFQIRDLFLEIAHEKNAMLITQA